MLSWCLQTLHNLFVDLFNIRMQAAKATGVLHSGKLGLYSCRPTRCVSLHFNFIILFDDEYLRLFP